MKSLSYILIIRLFLFSSEAFCQSKFIDSLESIISLKNHDEQERKAYSQLGIEYLKSDHNKTKYYLRPLIKQALEANDIMHLSVAYSSLLTVYQNEGNMDSTNYFVDKIKALAATDISNKSVLVNCNQALGLYYKKKGEYKIALPYNLTAINAGLLYNSMGDFKNAMSCNLKALTKFEEAGNKRGESFCYNNMSGIYISLGQLSRALQTAEKSLGLKRELNDVRGSCTSLQSIGLAYLKMQNFPLAMKNYEAALQVALSEDLPSQELNCYFNMGKIYGEQKLDSIAIVYYKKCRTIAVALESKSMIANADMELAILNNNKNKLKQSEDLLESSLQTFKETGNLGDESQNYKQLSEFYESNGNFEKALLYANKFHNLKDSITGTNVQVQFKQLEEQYNSVKKEKQISQLRVANVLQEQQAQKQKLFMLGALIIAILATVGTWLVMNRNKYKHLMHELEIRNQIAADLHDEVGSSLSSINMLSQMVAAKSEKGSPQKMMLQKMSTNAQETVEKMSDIVWMIKPGETEVSSLRKRMERFAYDIGSTKNIDVQMDLEELKNPNLTMEHRKNIYLIFKEAVNNAVKYSDTDKLEITSSNLKKNLVLLIKDFGKGYDAKLVPSGNGLNNMQHRARELGGTLNIHSELTVGTTIVLNVPI